MTKPPGQGGPRTDEPSGLDGVLTPMERTALRLLAAGHTTAGIAAVMNYSERHVRRLTRRICEFLGAGSVAQAVLIAGDLGLLDQPGVPR